jgi:hypothetical protein
VLGAVAAGVLAVAGTGLAALGTACRAPRRAPVAGRGDRGLSLMRADAGPDDLVLGQNTVGQLSDGTHTDSLVPLKVSALAPAIDIAAGEYHSCAVTTANEVWCWGQQRQR